MLQNAYLDAKFRFDTDENEPGKESCVVANRRSSSDEVLRLEVRQVWEAETRSATTRHSFLGSFSAVSKRNFASKYAFCSIFQNLQNYLAEFSKSCKILQKIAIFAENQHLFVKIWKFLQNFTKFRKILQIF